MSIPPFVCRAVQGCRSMFVNADQASRCFNQLPKMLRSPYHDPFYVKIDASEKISASPYFFVYEKCGEIYFHPFHAITTANLNVLDIESARGYGGPIFTTVDESFLHEASVEYKFAVSELGAVAEFIRFSPILNNSEGYYGTKWYDRKTCAISCDTYVPANNSHGFNLNIKKAIASGCSIEVTLQPNALQIEKFNTIYNRRMISLKATEQYLYSSQYLASLVDGKNEFYFAMHGEEVIGVSIFLVSEAWVEYHLSAATPEGMNLGVVSLILHVCAERHSNRTRLIHLGGGTDQKENNGLLNFKKGVGKMDYSYIVGGYIHQQEKYDTLKNIGSFNSNRFLFYR